MGVGSATGAGGQAQRAGAQKGGAGGGMLLELVDRILNKGIVIDVWARVSLLSIEVLTVEARVVVASVDTYQKYAADMANTALASRPQQANVVEAEPAPQQVQTQSQPQALPQSQQPLMQPQQQQALPQQQQAQAQPQQPQAQPQQQTAQQAQRQPQPAPAPQTQQAQQPQPAPQGIQMPPQQAPQQQQQTSQQP